ncbi:MAG: UbiD family decarboxylase domain-containing protein [Phycisphaerales bacterium]
MFASTSAFIEALERCGELVRISEPVSPLLEVSRIADLVSKSRAPHAPSGGAQRNDPRFFASGGPALLFERVEGSDFPLLINAWGSYRRTELALGCHEPLPGIPSPRWTPDRARHGNGPPASGFDAIGAAIGELVKPQPPRSLSEALSKARQFAPLLKIGPRRLRSNAPVQQVVRTGDQIDLTRLPIIRCWPHDADFAALGYPPDANDGIPGIDAADARLRGRYITLAGIHTIHADDADADKPASHNIGMYRVQLLGPDRVAMHWHMHHDGASHWRSWKKRGEPMPVAIALGGPSPLPYAATAPLPPGISELLMFGFLNGNGLRMVRAKTVPLWVPADADFIIEGWVSHEAGPIGWDPRDPEAGPLGPDAVFEGPFGDHTGFYSMPDRYPIVRISALTHRRDAVYPTTIVGLPPQEDYYLGKATERIFFPLLKTLIHDIEDYDLPMFGAFHNCACVRIKKAYPLQARRVMHAIWGAGQMAWTKTLFIVDESVDVHDLGAVMRACAQHCDPARDLELANGPLDILDHAAPRLGAGLKVGFDCTPKWPGEQANGVPIEQRALPILDARDAARYLDAVRRLDGVTDAAMPGLTAGAWLFIALHKTRPGQGYNLAQRTLESGDFDLGLDLRALPRFIVVLDSGIPLANADEALFHWVANSDASRDAVFHRPADAAGLPAPGGRVAFDATPKDGREANNGQPVRAWPPVLAMDEDTTDLVAGRWEAYAGGKLARLVPKGTVARAPRGPFGPLETP